MAVYGLMESFEHTENGMPLKDMQACSRVATKLNEVIIFRSTGPWSRRWIERGYPTKNFHVKGKSSDWGPQAGFVPYLGIYSKVGANSEKANAGTGANDDGLKHHFAKKVTLKLTLEEITTQATKPEENPKRFAVYRMEKVPNSNDYFLFSKRSGDQAEFVFRAVMKGTNYFDIHVYLKNCGLDIRKLIHEKHVPLEVMTSSETGAQNKPMTGDYDLMSVCPTWNDYGSRSLHTYSKPGLVFDGKGEQAGLTFNTGSNMDGVLDMRTNTGARPSGGDTSRTFQGLTKKDGGKLQEHGDMGNLTPRILRCINELNLAMGAVGTQAPFRRVHHNAESHRNHIFAALTAAEMQKGDGLPLTAFQPLGLQSINSPTHRYLDVATLETLDEFKQYAV